MYLVCICGLNGKVRQTPNSALTGADSAKLMRYWSSILGWTKKATVQSRKSDIDAIESGHLQDWQGDCRTGTK